MDETKKLARLMIIYATSCALISVISSLIVGEAWPLFLAAFMLVVALIVAVGEALRA